jgi:hypothetical protein
MRYYQKGYGYADTPGTASYPPKVFFVRVGNDLAGSTGGAVGGASVPLAFKKVMRGNPTVVLYDYDGTANAVRLYPDDTKRSGVTAMSCSGVGGTGAITFDSSSATAIEIGDLISAMWTAAAEL